MLTPPSGKKKVFIIEDDPFLVKAYKFAFQKQNLEVWVAQDGETAVSFLDRDIPDIVLLDLMLPGMNGFEVLEKIRANARWKNVAVMIVSNLGQPTDIEKSKNLGVTDYKVKSDVNIEEIVNGVMHFFHLG